MNGWKNWHTWAVALWLGNDEGLYNLARRFAKYPHPYKRFFEYMNEAGEIRCPEGFRWDSPMVCRPEINRMIKELAE
jgi:hypothetical protein